MIIGILTCGKKYQSILDLYHNFLLIANPNIKVKCFDCINSHFPTSDDYKELDGFMITGSRFSSYDDKKDNIEWIRQLKEKIREMDTHKVKLVGICFGHQIIAEALGGKVIQNPKGWEVSVTDIYTNKLGRQLFERDVISIQEMHKDIVSSIDKTNLQIFAYNDSGIQGLIKDNHIFTLQGHPEYNPDNISRLLNARRKIIPYDTLKKGMNKINLPTNKRFLSQFIVNFFVDNK